MEVGTPLLLRRPEITQALTEEKANFLIAERVGWNALLIVPVLVKGKVLGLVILGARAEESFCSSAITLIQAMANQIVTEIMGENARDPLTSLHNRSYFLDRIRREMARAEREKHLMALLQCDLDQFRNVNEAIGHRAGDELLKVISTKFREVTRGTDLVFRWEGDEIVVILSKTSREGSLEVANRIREGVHEAAEKVRLDLDVSIGIVFYPEHGAGPDELILAADKALHIAKKCGRKIHIGEEEYQLGPQSVKAVFQPIVDIWSKEILGYEALTRDPQGLLSVPELFQKYHAIGQLDDLKKICFQSQIRIAEELQVKRLFINADFNLLRKMEPISKPAEMDVVIELSELEALDDLEGHLRIADQ